MNTPTYAGEIAPADAWSLLDGNSRSWLVDVRTQAEWTYVGLPDLAALERQIVLVSWQLFPTMARNEAFPEQLAAQGIGKTDTVLFICRSGIRSKAAAELMTALGWTSCWNVSDGFEGPLDDHRHRGGKGGWKAAGLPWIQG